MKRSTVDENCPNARLHPRGKRGDSHSLTTPVLRDLLHRQLVTSMDEHCKSLHLLGARGKIFKLSLSKQGYTFIGKATTNRYVPCLQHEGRIYHRLRKLQGNGYQSVLGTSTSMFLGTVLVWSSSICSSCRTAARSFPIQSQRTILSQPPSSSP